MAIARSQPILVYGTQQCNEFEKRLTDITIQMHNPQVIMATILTELELLAGKQPLHEILNSISPRVRQVGFEINNITNAFAKIVKELSVFQKPHPLEATLKVTAQSIQALIKIHKHGVDFGKNAVNKLQQETTALKPMANGIKI